MNLFLKGWPWIWLLLAMGSLLVDDGFDQLAATVIFGILLGSIYSMVGLYLNMHLRRSRWKIPALGAFSGVIWVVVTFWGEPPRAVGFVLLVVFALFVSCLVQSLVYLLPGQRPAVETSTGPSAEGWRPLGLTRITGQGAEVLAIRGVARALRQVEHGGRTDQYLTFSPGDEVLASWTPGQVQLFSTTDGSSLGVLKERGLLGFSRDGRQLLTVHAGKVERYSLPNLQECRIETQEESKPDWRSLGKGWAFSLESGLVVSMDSPESTIEFPYRTRVCVSRGLIAIPGTGCVRLETLKGERLWESPNVGRDVTSTGFSADGRRLAFATMGGSIFLVDTEALEIRQQCMADGEVRCLAVSKDGTVAVGCADLSSKVWLFNAMSGQPESVIDSYSDSWGVAFSHDNRLLATGHENGCIQIWSREQLPVVEWLKVAR